MSPKAHSAVSHPPVRLQKDGRAQVLVLVPPVARARSTAASAKDALVQTVELGTVLNRLEVLLGGVRKRRLLLEPGLNRLVLLVEIVHVGHKILNHIHVRKRVDLDCNTPNGALAQYSEKGMVRHTWATSLDVAEARKRVAAVDVHGARATDTLAARAAEGEGGVNLVLDLDKSVQDHRAALGQVNCERLKTGLVIGNLGVLRTG